MKKLNLIILFIIGLAVVTTAQDQGQLRLFTTATFGSDLGVEDADFQNGDRGFKTGLGLNGGLEYFVVDNISINPNYTYFFRSGGNQIIEVGI